MNIHFKDKNLFEQLKQATIAKVKVGSFLYGTQNENSDQDYLYIYATSQNELNSFIWTNHQLQYKEEGIDHNFVSVHSFIRNCLNGDSTINFEVIQSDELLGTKLAFLTENKKAFHTYTITRSYNGFGQRDCKYYFKENTSEKKYKKLKHIIRGYTYAEALLNNCFDFKQDNEHFISKLPDKENDNIVKFYSEILKSQRLELNKKLDNDTLGLAKIIDIKNANLINNELLDLQKTNYWKEKKEYIEDFDMNYFINAFENWVEYENK